MAEKFSVPELAALRSELLLGFDSKDAAELVQLFLAGHGYGVSPEAARYAVSRVGTHGQYTGGVPAGTGEHRPGDVRLSECSP